MGEGRKKTNISPLTPLPPPPISQLTRDVPGIDAAFLAMDLEEGVEVVWSEVRYSNRKLAKGSKVLYVHAHIYASLAKKYIYIYIFFLKMFAIARQAKLFFVYAGGVD